VVLLSPDDAHSICDSTTPAHTLSSQLQQTDILSRDYTLA
jgi:hypothetical protein